MSEDQGFVLHPQAAQDITDIWEFSPRLTRWLLAVSAKTSWPPSAHWYLFPIKVTGGLPSPHALYGSRRCVIT